MTLGREGVQNDLPWAYGTFNPRSLNRVEEADRDRSSEVDLSVVPAAGENKSRCELGKIRRRNFTALLRPWVYQDPRQAIFHLPMNRTWFSSTFVSFISSFECVASSFVSREVTMSKP